MSRYLLPCECGELHELTAGDSGTNRECKCGREITTPSLGILNSRFSVEGSNDDTDEDNPEEQESPSILAWWIMWVFGVIVGILVYWLTEDELWFGLIAGVWPVIVGELWIKDLMVREMGTDAKIYAWIPLVGLFFVFNRLELAWQPFLMQLLGVGLFISSYWLK